MNWYVIHTKPRQEQRALRSLMEQGFDCYLPMIAIEKVRQGVLGVASEPLFPRYLFISLDDTQTGRSWSPIRSTKGVSRLVTFGTQPAKAPENMINLLRAQEKSQAGEPKPLFAPGEPVLITDSAFSGIEGIYQRLMQTRDGESRAVVLIELLSRPAQLKISLQNLRKLG
jgi:transcriptional antiterminator RfaH